MTNNHEFAISPQKKIVIIAGPNGAGKTTFAQEFLPQEAECPLFINADLIASGLSPFQPDAAALKAGRLMLQEIESYVAQGKSFAFETTLSGKIYARRIPEWQKMGYWIKLFYLSLPNVELAIARVASRVLSGGHSVPEDAIRRRFEIGRIHFETLYKPIVDSWILYDNSSTKPIVIDRGKNT
ncbi:MAG: zeta toxin family protein [Candidatus Omnitrophota bacterium]